MGKEDISDILFNMKFAAKQMTKSATKAEKESDKAKLQVKQALEKGNPEAARIYAENSIRKRNESLNYLRLSSRIDAAASRVNTAVQMKDVTKAMKSTVKGLDNILTSMDPYKIAKVMDEFESQMGTLDVNLGTMEAAFQSTSASTVPVGQVDSLMEQLAAENNINISNQLSNGQMGSRIGQPQQANQVTEDDITERLKALQAL
ncbi:charged multivesicular body protein 1 [Strigomonas culicis]|uniref:Charged multivesicular body protein 1 n=1 Tax=Strigomonas culicis TaxID=28005 RepID=S9U5H7_9TRYP|nr:charged multivesicular body protein 1 [Strigomonas culicis]EPY33675.1 charged multivesicular body protein 1 [Strigomonas culicis]|eukprot:EPY24009.1 charged multivesicular body protein 1 [Strigomonas culicis]